MPLIDVVVSSNRKLTTRARQVCGMFDCPPDEKRSLQWRANLPLEDKKWNVGLIVGASGSGKTTCAKALFPAELSQSFIWGDDSIIDDFPKTKSLVDISYALSSVGFGTVPAWIRPYAVLSNGEKFRADIARRLVESEGVIVVDEFTSVVDRQTAKVASYAVQKAVRKQDKQFVGISCHHDIEDWLLPDWVFYPSSNSFEWRSHRQRPEIEIEVARLPYEAWKVFAPFHYMSKDLHRAAACFGLWANGTLAAFAAVLHRPHPTSNIKGVSRCVTLPDWQGLGLAFHLLEALGSAYSSLGSHLHIYPAHPSFARAVRKESWSLQSKIGIFSNAQGTRRGKSSETGLEKPSRSCATFRFIGNRMGKEQAQKLIGSL